MSYFALGGCLLLATHVVVSTAVGLLTALAEILFPHRLERGPARERASRLLLLRLLPTTAGLSASLLVVGPAYVAFEPWNTGEPVTTTLGVLALGGGLLLAAGFGRAAFEAVRTRRLVRAWSAGAIPLTVAAPGVRALRIRSASPVVLLAGWIRPRVLVSGRVLACCDRAELDAIVAHEAAHREAADNLKRLALAAAADPFSWTRQSRRLEERWIDTAEEAADDRAAAESDPVSLAGALLKVARLVGGGERGLVASSICHGERVARRVRRLLERGAPGQPAAPAPAGRGIAARAIPVVAIAAAVAVSTGFPFVHGLIELAVRSLP